MLIDIPVHIIFNADGLHPPPADGHRVFTMRYDIHDAQAPARYTDHFPPRANATWGTDAQNLLFSLFTRSTEERIRTKALAYPPDYSAAAIAES
jgi:hypothetical protein